MLLESNTNMLHQLSKFTKQKFILAFSSGVDSVAVADFYKRGNKDFALAYFNHSTPNANKMEEFTINFANKLGIKYYIGKISRDKFKTESMEEYWRNERYNFLNSFNTPIVTCHHLDDAVETWIFSCFHGNPKIIAPINQNIYRPFLLNKKEALINWAIQHNQTWIEDLSNKDIKFPRNRIRHNIVKEALQVNPGLYKVIKKKIMNGYLT